MAPPKAALAAVDPAITRLIVGVVAIGLLGWSGLRAARRAAAATSELKAVQATIADFAELRKRFAPAAAAESIAWRRTLMELQSLGVADDERLAITREVASAAESAGLQNVKVVIGEADTTGVAERLSKGGVGRKSASFGLTVEARGGMASVLTFLGRLPLSVTATSLGMQRDPAGGARHRVSLAVYELTFENDPPPGLWAPAQRDSAGAGRAARPGG